MLPRLGLYTKKTLFMGKLYMFLPCLGTIISNVFVLIILIFIELLLFIFGQCIVHMLC